MSMKIALVISSYFLGNISMAILIGRMVKGIDIREYGSGNAGTTNVLRTLGKKAAIITLLGDVLKGVIAVWIGFSFGSNELAMLCGIAVVLGHIWPIVFGFKGGKGIATGIGVIFVTTPIPACICLAIGIVILILTRYVSLASVIGMGILPVVIYFYDESFFVWALVLSIVAVYGHRTNIKRLINKTESKIKF